MHYIIEMKNKEIKYNNPPIKVYRYNKYGKNFQFLNIRVTISGCENCKILIQLNRQTACNHPQISTFLNPSNPLSFSFRKSKLF